MDRIKLYSNLTRWIPLLTPPADYAAEAAVYLKQFLRHDPLTNTILELGCGGRHNASHLKKHFKMTLTDISPEMLALSKKLNPECEHLTGDMRSLRLNRSFDAVFMHDAIGYMTTLQDLLQAVETAERHCKKGGCLLIMPDFFKETFVPATSHGGTDGEGEGMRYLEWNYDPDPDDHTYVSDMALLLLDREGNVTVEHDRNLKR